MSEYEETKETFITNSGDINYNSNGVRPRGQRHRVASLNKEKSLTKQHDAKKANIHNILKAYERTGLLPQRTVEPLEGQLPDVSSYHQAMNILVEAQQTFDQLPSDIRQKFDNDPSKFLDYVNATNEDGELANIEEMREIGLAETPAIPVIQQVEVVQTTTTTETSSEPTDTAA